jgi:hypothetical protein
LFRLPFHSFHKIAVFSPPPSLSVDRLLDLMGKRVKGGQITAAGGFVHFAQPMVYPRPSGVIQVGHRASKMPDIVV